LQEKAAVATHPVEPELPPDRPEPDPKAPNPTHLPVEPEFGPVLEPALPEEPWAKPPVL
jgi:hypothetical protein